MTQQSNKHSREGSLQEVVIRLQNNSLSLKFGNRCVNQHHSVEHIFFYLILFQNVGLVTTL